jgi:hypothetical protein
MGNEDVGVYFWGSFCVVGEIFGQSTSLEKD